MLFWAGLADRGAPPGRLCVSKADENDGLRGNVDGFDLGVVTKPSAACIGGFLLVNLSATKSSTRILSAIYRGRTPFFSCEYPD